MSYQYLRKVSMLFASAIIAGSVAADACSLLSYRGDSSLVIVGRSLDWKNPIPTSLYVYPRGMSKVGNLSPDAVKWTSRYGAVYAVSYDGGVTEGMNERGLSVNGLFCKGANYGTDSIANEASMSLAVFVAWLLDMNATTDEAVAALRAKPFSISGATFDGGTAAALHWAITDASGKSAILEFEKGVMRIYDGDSVHVLTNDPPYPSMLAIKNYWERVGGANMLPGTVRSSDRFVRAWFFDDNVERVGDARTGLAITRSIIMNVSVPYRYTVEGAPNVSSTQWRSFANLRDKKYYFELVTNLGVVYIDLQKCDLQPGASVKKLVMDNSSDKVGMANSLLVDAAPFTPMY